MAVAKAAEAIPAAALEAEAGRSPCGVGGVLPSPLLALALAPATAARPPAAARAEVGRRRRPLLRGCWGSSAASGVGLSGV